MNLTQSQKDQINQLEKEHTTNTLDLVYHIENSNAQDIEELSDFFIEQGVFNIEIIYYHTAIDYLKQYDPSLRESIEYALNLQYDLNTNDISSETLASIHASEENRASYYENIEPELDTILFNN